jgi:hypothetical protein
METRRPRTLWLTDSEYGRVERLGRVKQEEAGRVGRKALMLGVSIMENGIGSEASIAGVR